MSQIRSDQHATIEPNPYRPQAPVLFVEDDTDAREAFQFMLERYGYRVETAANGDEALKKLRAGIRPCLIVLDLLMEGMNGYEFRHQQLSASEEIARIPVIVFSGLYDVGNHAKRLGAVGHFNKPVDIDRVFQLIALHCRPD